MWGLGSIFSGWFGNSSEVDLGEFDVGPKLPHDYDEYQWWNPFDWAGNYDKDMDAYSARKRQGLIKNVMIVTCFFCLFVILKNLND